MDGPEVIKGAAIAMSVTFLVWVSAIAYASSRLVWLNWRELMTWCHQPRDMRVNLALWTAVPGMKVWLLWMRSVDTWALMTTNRLPNMHAFVGLPVALVMLGLMVWWICDRSFGPRRGDRICYALLSVGVALGASLGLAFTLGEQ